MKLHEIQQKLKAPKSQYNTFGKYHYRNCEDILEALKPLLGDSILTLSDEIVNVGNRYYVKASARFYEPGEDNENRKFIGEVTAYARETLDRKGMDDSQITGAASSYARKYALNGLFLIDDTKDADSDDGNDASKPVKPTVIKTETLDYRLTTADPITEQKKQIMELLSKLGHQALNKDGVAAAVQSETGLELIEVDYDEIIDRLQVLVAEK